MLTYNTQRKRLVLPEYGRNIQRMVDHCMSIEDRDERTRCAHTIVRSMGNLFPELRAEENYHKLWDHLAIMSDFKLDIDYPCEIVKPDELNSKPEVVDYSQSRVRFRHYGKIIEQLIDSAAAMEEGPEREQLVMLIANQMKKQMLAVNPDGVEDQKIFNDLALYSHGAIRLDPRVHHLHEFMEVPVAQNGGKKKKKK